MEECYSANLKSRINGRSIAVGSSNVRYGKQEGAREKFEAILKIENRDVRNHLIDEVLDEMGRNCNENGFFPDDYVVKVDAGNGGHSFKLDDRSIYYNFFDTYKLMQDKYVDKSPNLLYRNAIINTVQNYFGEYNGNHELRQSLTEEKQVFYDDKDDFEFVSPSISKQKGLGCAQCVERASVAHNLFLLGGYESYYVHTSSVKFKDSDDKGHAFCFVNFDDSFKMLDISMKRSPGFEKGENPVEDILNGKPFIVGEDVYANYANLNEEISEE